MNLKKLLLGFALALMLVGQALHAQQSEADCKLLAGFRAKAENGDAQSQFELGCAYEYGKLGVAKDNAEAVKWYSKAAEQNYAKAQINLGGCYISGQGVRKDATEAVKWYRKAAEQGDAEAQYWIGHAYADGYGVTKNATEAVKWYRKAAEQGDMSAQIGLSQMYASGEVVAKDAAEATKWYRKMADQGHPGALYLIAQMYEKGHGVPKDAVEAAKWYHIAAERGCADALYELGRIYANGEGVPKDAAEAVKWYRKATERDVAEAAKWFPKVVEQQISKAQYALACCYFLGEGVTKDYVEAYKWSLLAAVHGDENIKKLMTSLENLMTREQIAEGQKLARNFKQRSGHFAGSESSGTAIAQTRPTSSGTGFFITEDGYLITNEHVAGNGALVRLITATGILSAKVVKVDAANDLSLLKVEGRFVPLPLAASRTVKLGNTVATVGFPNIGLQGFAPKLAKGEIASLAGATDDARYFQISVPVQPGNSGGALVDERGNVVGVVSAKLSAQAALAASGALPENVNYAVKSSFLLGFLESVPEVAAKLKEPETKERKFEDVVKSAEQAAVLVLVY